MDRACEERLQRLVTASQEANRFRWTEEWKRQGKKVIGLLDAYIPEEVVHAAGMLPWQIIGSWQQTDPRVEIYRPGNTCRYCAHVLSSLLAGDLDFLDGLVGSDWDDDRRRLFDQWTHVRKQPFQHILHIPVVDSDLTRRLFIEKVARLADKVGEFAGARITDDALSSSIALYNRMRSLLMKVYELRKREKPPVTGAEALGLTTAAFVMPKEEYVRELEALIPYLEVREIPALTVRPRLLVSSDRLDNPAYLALVESAGALVAMDDLDTGSRYFWRLIEPGDNPVAALAQRYLLRPACPRMLFWPRQLAQVIEWAREWKIDGIINFPQRFTYPRLFATPYFRDQMAKAGIPFITIERQYRLGNEGQLLTRIEAFLETLAATEGEARR
ncbi:MAG: 2-hydroxyacyl-CoA dehydratase [Chloroflexi bacterium]|nr:2-hydroxyacyl-CoA dehydratase [Chloroflexota bacterium]